MSGVAYREAASENKVAELPLAHLSVEVGHCYMEDLLRGEDHLREQFRAAAPFVDAARAAVRSGTNRPRVSTCFLLDDYFSHEAPPGDVVETVRRVAAECGTPIDYMVRESGCRLADGIDLARMTEGYLLPEPGPGTNGSRPPPQESGWLSNGEGSPNQHSQQAMVDTRWAPPREYARRNHSIFVDVELWRDVEGERLWSCPFLAAVWHLLRLGLLRHGGDPVAVPQPAPPAGAWPEEWDELPVVMRLEERAAPFAAYRSVSVLPQQYQPVEHAAKVILDRLRLDQGVIDQVVRRAEREGVVLPLSLTGRMGHVFLESAE